MDLNKYAIGQNDPILNKWEDSDTFHDFLHKCYEDARNQYEITVNEYSKFEHTMNIEVEYDANNDDRVTFLYNLYYNVPEPNQLINAGNGFYLSKQTALYVTDEYEKQIDVDNFKLTSTYKEYYIIDNAEYLDYLKKSIGESKNKRRRNMLTESLEQYLVKYGSKEENAFDDDIMPGETLSLGGIVREGISESRKTDDTIYGDEIPDEFYYHHTHEWKSSRNHEGKHTYHITPVQEFSFNLYYNVPEPNDLLKLPKNYFISKYSYYLEYDEIVASTHENMREEPDQTDPYKENVTLAKVDNTNVQKYVYEYLNINDNVQIEAKKIYEVSSKKSKYLLVESSNGFYKTPSLNDISKYKKVNAKKAKAFIDNPKNMWNGITVIDTMLPARTIKLLENHDTNLQNAIDTFYKKTGIKLEKVHSTADKVFFHGVEPKHKLDVELTLVLTNGGYSIKELGSGLQMDQEVATNYKPIIQKINKLMREIFSNL